MLFRNVNKMKEEAWYFESSMIRLKFRWSISIWHPHCKRFNFTLFCLKNHPKKKHRIVILNEHLFFLLEIFQTILYWCITNHEHYTELIRKMRDKRHVLFQIGSVFNEIHIYSSFFPQAVCIHFDIVIRYSPLCCFCLNKCLTASDHSTLYNFGAYSDNIWNIWMESVHLSQ